MLKTIRRIIAVIVIILACYGLFTKDYDMQQYMMFFLSLLMLVMGIEEFQNGQKMYANICIAVCLFLLFISFLGF
ncbi:DUF3953 domain-containing protein [Metabacillus niabensis]|uniref:DUF3953 domain-containing protein n=1 Tax=Metabacillus niabensis TaxID=324854 RepID=UPI001CFAA930|nr:DUF3953 domain-containing protein [Metabacillus niabensis]